MGAWGTGISSNDDFCEVYEAFFRLYNQGCEIPGITKELMEQFGEILTLDEVCQEFWFALAKAQWECKALDRAVFDKVKEFVDSGHDIAVWQRQGASDKVVKQRKKVLNEFVMKLATEKESARKRKIVRFIPSPFRQGDCIVFSMSNGNYGGLFVLETLAGDTYELAQIAQTNINLTRKPEITDFENACVLLKKEEALSMVRTHGNKARDQIYWFAPSGYRKYAQLFEVIGSMYVGKRQDEIKCIRSGPQWENLISLTEGLLATTGMSVPSEEYKLINLINN